MSFKIVIEGATQTPSTKVLTHLQEYNMNKNNWLKKIEIVSSLDSLVEFREILDSEEDLTEQELDLVLDTIARKEDELIKSTPKRSKKQENEETNQSIVKIFKSELYDRNADEDKPGYQILMGPGMSLNEFLKEIFYKEFIKLPEPDIQVAICMAVGYLNSMTIPDTVNMPMVYIYSPEAGSGKSQLAYHWGDYYHPRYRLMFRDDITGAGLRNSITPIAVLDQPMVCIVDNYHASRTKERMGVVGWASFMANTRVESNSQVVADTEGGVVSFNTHSLKIFTSITPLGNTVEQSSELKSRCIRIYANKEKGGINLFRTSYNWEGLQKEYLNIWGDPDACNRVFKKGLIKDLLQRDPKTLPFHNREWQISIPLMASGVFAGVWSNLDQAISHLADYWEWESGKKSNKMSPLESVISNYISEVHPRLVKEHLEDIEGTRRRQKLFYDVIKLSDVYEHLKQLAIDKAFSEFKQTTTNDSLITALFYGFGFVSAMEKTESGRILGMYFYKQ